MPSRPTIEEREAYLAQAVEKVRAFPEFREMDLRAPFLQRFRRSRRLRRMKQEVREFPEFAEVPFAPRPANARECRFARAAVGNRRMDEYR